MHTTGGLAQGGHYTAESALSNAQSKNCRQADKCVQENLLQ
jgi:hypothetical protein